jgi:hypothetical protein
MNLNLKYIGIVKNADVRLDGLTVIAGENDTGKSTVGKLMFSIVKAVSRYEQDLNVSKEHNIIRMMEEIYVVSRNAIINTENINFDVFQQEFHPNRFYKEVKPFVHGNQSTLFETQEEAINKIFESRENLIKTEFSESLKTRILPKLEDLKKLFLFKKTAVSEY